MVSIKFTRDREGKRLRHIRDAPTYGILKHNKYDKTSTDINEQTIRVHDKLDVSERKDGYFSKRSRVIRRFRSNVKHNHGWTLTRTLNPRARQSFQYVMQVAFMKGGKTQVIKGFSFRKQYARSDYAVMRQEAWEMAFARCTFSPERFKILEEYFIGYNFGSQ